ncbi:class I SAM-dependent methyltransferase [Sinorhizobium numidicum]|uniref:Class I SAM-dependent methyltransferase n=1 Tax=Sinorhizobium numidicum TaxID=680248 RepID=A0ABY8CRV7_9HYPH|nr:class I SAM-dependent methyltransferase [Sinorhizobium numidicum]WEX74646.1 class I SAM-dependent methyltransferase [Sinorhizobium numidicum]WEX80637.1 class I SAM-dependent methyltransferase [Sinorhizobium numidicum]
MKESRHNSSILAFQQKRGKDSVAFFLPFLGPDMTVLDIGCGPGTITAALASVVANVIGLDLEPKAIEAAKQLARGCERANLSFIEADMTALPFDSDTVDAVFFHAVLYHQSQEVLTRTLAEARRVLKPGGLLATRDADAGGNVLYPESQGLCTALDLWQRWYEHADPEAPRFGRRQASVLRAHGFVPIWSGASYVNHSEDAFARNETVADARRSLLGLGSELVTKGLAEDAEIQAALAAWDCWGSDPDSVYFRCRCECVARKTDQLDTSGRPGV